MILQSMRAGANEFFAWGPSRPPPAPDDGGVVSRRDSRTAARRDAAHASTANRA